jgi:preprotein translocase subunit SecE
MADLNEKLPEEAASSAAEKKAKEEKKPNFFVRTWGKIKKFFRDYVSEMKKVVWYPRDRVIRDTGIAVAVLVVCGALIGVLDLIFAQLILLLGKIG